MDTFPIQNEPLAIAMVNAGCTLAEKPWGPLENSHTPASMRAFGLLSDDESDVVDFELAVIKLRTLAMRALESKRSAKRYRGQITYRFVRDERLAEYLAEMKALAIEEAKAKKEGRRMEVEPVIKTPRESARVDFFRLPREKQMVEELPWCVDSTCRIGDAKFEPSRDLMAIVDEMKDPVKKDASVEIINARRFGTTTIEDAQSWTLGMTNEDREKLGIHPRPGPPEFYRQLLAPR